MAGVIGNSRRAWINSLTAFALVALATIAPGAQATDADIEVVKTSSASPATQGIPFTYTVTITNHGPTVATNIHFSDQLDESLTFLDGSSTHGECERDGRLLTCDIDELGVGETATLTVDVFPVLIFSASDPLCNEAEAWAAGPDPNPDNNVSEVCIEVLPAEADMEITKVDTVDPVALGQEFSYIVTVTNFGPSVAIPVTVEDIVPPELEILSVTTSLGSHEIDGNVINWRPRLLLVGESASMEVAVRATSLPASGDQVCNVASVGKFEIDQNLSNNFVEECTTITDGGGEDANLEILKTGSEESIGVGEELIYTLTVNNLGPDTASEVGVTDVLPEGASFVSAASSQGSCEESLGVVNCALGDLVSGASATVEITVLVEEFPSELPVGCDGLLNIASVSSETNDSETENNTAELCTPRRIEADLAIDIGDDPDPVQVNTELTYILTVTNHGPNDATGVTVNNLFPDTVSFVSSGEGDSGPVAPTIDLSVGGLLVGESVSYELVVIPGMTGLIVDTATVTGDPFDPNLSNNLASEETLVIDGQASADLVIDKTASSDPVNVGDEVTYTISVVNLGPDGASGVTAIDTLPDGVEFISATPSQGSCEHVAGVVTCDLGDLAAMGLATIEVVVRVLEPITIVAAGDLPPIECDFELCNSAEVTGDQSDPDALNNTIEICTGVDVVDLSITKNVSVAEVTPSQQFVYTVLVTNLGPDDASNVVMTDLLPLEATFVSVNSTQGSSEESSGIAFGATASVEITVVVAGCDQGADICNTASVTGDQYDCNPLNNSQEECIACGQPLPMVDLQVIKDDDGDMRIAGDIITYTVTVTNLSDNTATNVTVSDSWLTLGEMSAEEVNFISATSSQGSCEEVDGTITCNLGTILSSESATITVQLQPMDEGDLCNVANASADQQDSDPLNNEDTECTWVDLPDTDLTVVKDDDGDMRLTGDTIVYTVTVTNTGGFLARDVVVEDNWFGIGELELAEITYINSSVSQGTATPNPTAGTISWNVGDLAAGAMATMTCSLIPNDEGDLCNVATVTARSPDANTANNEETECTWVDIAPAAAVPTDLTVAVVETADPAMAGHDLTYTVTVFNAGPNTATNVALEDVIAAMAPMPADGVAMGHASPAQGTQSHTGNTASCYLGAIPVGGSVDVEVMVIPFAAGDVMNTANVSAHNVDTDMDNNEAVEITSIVPLNIECDAIVQHILGVTVLTGSSLTSCDLEVSGVVDAADLVRCTRAEHGTVE
jgi:uncharacterized repeat protein (TIGR01451 family)